VLPKPTSILASIVTGLAALRPLPDVAVIVGLISGMGGSMIPGDTAIVSGNSASDFAIVFFRLAVLGPLASFIFSISK
jgi:hypothetical protein